MELGLVSGSRTSQAIPFHAITEKEEHGTGHVALKSSTYRMEYIPRITLDT